MQQGLSVKTVQTKPIDGQKTGTSGLRKKTNIFTGENYLANWCVCWHSKECGWLQGHTGTALADLVFQCGTALLQARRSFVTRRPQLHQDCTSTQLHTEMSSTRSSLQPSSA